MSVLTEQALKKMKVPDLKAELKLRKLKVSGKKDELIQRLLNAQTEGILPSTDEEPVKPAQTTKRKATELEQPKVDPKKKKPEPKQEPSEDESDEDEGSKDDYKDEGDDEEDDEVEDEDVASDEGLKPLTASGWGKALAEEYNKPYFKGIIQFVKEERKINVIFPPKNLVFNAFSLTPIDQVKIVIIGQDPYINDGEAHGLCFSVMRGIPIPPSLKRIYKAMESTVPGFKSPAHGCLEEWAMRGVLMLNATLTVRKGSANSHQKCGWQTFTDNVIKVLCTERKGLIFFLWGNFAQKKGKIINSNEHFVLKCSHPSPMGGGGLWACDHFVKANEILIQQGKSPIDWTLSP